MTTGQCCGLTKQKTHLRARSLNVQGLLLSVFGLFIKTLNKAKGNVVAFIVLLSSMALVILQELKMPPRNYGTLFIFGNKVCF